MITKTEFMLLNNIKIHPKIRAHTARCKWRLRGPLLGNMPLINTECKYPK